MRAAEAALREGRLRCLDLLNERGAFGPAELVDPARFFDAYAKSPREPAVLMWLAQILTADAAEPLPDQGPPARRTRSQAARRQRRLLELFAAAARFGHLPVLKMLRWASPRPTRLHTSGVLQSSLGSAPPRDLPWSCSAALLTPCFSGTFRHACL